MSEFLGTEVPRQTVWAAEKGERDFRAAELIALAAALGTTIPELLRTDDDVQLAEGAGIDWYSYRRLASGTDSSTDAWTIYQIARDLRDEMWRIGELFDRLMQPVRFAVENDDLLRERVEADLSAARERLHLAWLDYYQNSGGSDVFGTFEEWSQYEHPSLPNTTPAIQAAEAALEGTRERREKRSHRVKRTVRGEVDPNG
ncbi:hypothetical protein [Microbacterium lacticum]